LIFLLPPLVVLLLVIAYPIIESFWISLQHWNLISNVQRWAGIDNYIALFTGSELPHSLAVTAVYTGVGVTLQFVLGLGLALLVRAGLRRRLGGFSGIRVLLLVPILVPPLLWGFYFRSFYSPQFGLFNQVLGWLGLSPVLWVNDSHLALWALILADTWQWTPFMFTILVAGLLALPRGVQEAAQIDGANGWQIFRLIELPLLAPLIVVAVLLRVIDSIQYLDLVYVITQGGPGTATELLNYLSFRTGFHEFEMGQAAAIAYVVLAVTMAVTVALVRLLRRR
jgi:multiple sugar transport system permease protein